MIELVSVCRVDSRWEEVKQKMFRERLGSQMLY